MIKLAIVMDPIDTIHPEKDTSFAMLLAAQQRGWQLHYLEMNDLYLQDGISYGASRQITVTDQAEDYYQFTSQQQQPLTDFDVILMRKDPPFDMEFIYATYLLERAEQQGVLVINKPQSLRDCNEKLFTAWFAQWTPPTLVSRNSAQLRQFWQQHRDIILKPLDGMGGSSVFRVTEQDNNFSVIAETLTAQQQRYCMAQRYLPAIKEGDKRVLVVAGQVIPYCLARIPQAGETRGNLAAGGRGEVRELSASDRQIAEDLAPQLLAKGLYFVGLDIIGDRLTEINVTSPTCAREIECASHYPVIATLMDAIEQQIRINS